MRLILTLILISLTFAVLPAKAEEPAWVTTFTQAYEAAEDHMTTLDAVLAERDGGVISPEALERLLQTHNALDVALEVATDALEAEQDRLIEVAVTCDTTIEACLEKIGDVNEFSEWALGALEGMSRLGLSLMLSETIINEELL